MIRTKAFGGIISLLFVFLGILLLIYTQGEPALDKISASDNVEVDGQTIVIRELLLAKGKLYNFGSIKVAYALDLGADDVLCLRGVIEEGRASLSAMVYFEGRSMYHKFQIEDGYCHTVGQKSTLIRIHWVADDIAEYPLKVRLEVYLKE